MYICVWFHDRVQLDLDLRCCVRARMHGSGVCWLWFHLSREVIEVIQVMFDLSDLLLRSLFQL